MERLSAEIRRDVLSSISRLIAEVGRAARNLESALEGRLRPGRPAGRRGPGRPPKRRGPGRPPGRTARGGRRAPRGALKKAIHSILASSPKPVALMEIRDRVRMTGPFRGRDPMSLYRQIVRDVQSLPGVRKAGRGRYGLSAAAPAPATRRRRGRPKAAAAQKG